MAAQCPAGGIGRRDGFKIRYLTQVSRFDSGLGHAATNWGPEWEYAGDMCTRRACPLLVAVPPHLAGYTGSNGPVTTPLGDVRPASSILAEQPDNRAV